jgi:hypothetical protein
VFLFKWTKVVEKTTTLETELHATTIMQQTILDNIKTSQEDMDVRVIAFMKNA